MKITQLRKSRGLTQADLAQRCDTTQQQIARIENGVVDPRLGTLYRVADALECEIGDLFFTRTEFLSTIQDIAKEHKLDVAKIGLLDLNSICARERYVPSFHPYWEKICVQDGRLTFIKE